MNSTNTNGKLVLGTVQLGLDYGINNKRGKPSREESLAILDKAFESGIRIFDTAFAYGDAEDILGEWMSGRGVSGHVSIISKLKPHAIADVVGSDVLRVIEGELNKSLFRLKREYLDGYLLHTPEYIYNEFVLSALEFCKKKGLVKNIGVSIYEEADALYAARCGRVDYIQVPYSVFDQRMDRGDFFTEAKKNGVTVFARSAFLQGLIGMEAREIPEHLSEARDYLRIFDAIREKYTLSRIRAALLFSREHPGIDHVVFGVDTCAQLDEDVRIAETGILPDACMSELRNHFHDIPKSIIFPSLWKINPPKS